MWNFERVLDAITNAGIYIIEKRSHTIIYCNKRFKELLPAAEVSLGCYEIGMDICNRCPLESYDPAKKEKMSFCGKAMCLAEWSKSVWMRSYGRIRYLHIL